METKGKKISTREACERGGWSFFASGPPFLGAFDAQSPREPWCLPSEPSLSSMTVVQPLQGPSRPSRGDRRPGEGPACPVLGKMALKAKPKQPGMLPAQRQSSNSPASVFLCLVPIPMVQGVFQIPLLPNAHSSGPTWLLGTRSSPMQKGSH